MAFIRTIPPEEAEGELKEIYEHELQTQQYVATGTISLSLRPEAFEAWEQMDARNTSVRTAIWGD